ncbi:MAG: hypothetical protein NTW85_09780 [Methylococcales bacterium]|nr:hypothetical protein [Methylococcales bacterium]
MAIIKEGNLSFIFDFDAIKFDDTSYYREHFSKIQNDIAAVDILAVNNGIGYLIEIKDYTHPDTENLTSSNLIDAIVKKVISTLSAILPMKNNAGNPEEKKIAEYFVNSSQIKVVLHIEKPPARRTLKQSCYDFQNIETSLKRKLKPIDAHPKVVSKENLKSLPWVVISI